MAKKPLTFGGHGFVMPLTITNTNNLNLTAYAVGQSTNLYVTIVNKDTNGPNASVTIVPKGFVTGSVQAMYLTAPGGAGATNGMTLGGATITNNAPWLGQWTLLAALTNGQCSVSVTNASAAIIEIQAATIFAPPLITGNLPPLVRLTPGKSYQYLVAATGGQPLAYQWYENNSKVAGASNANFFVTGGSAGNTTSYSVVVGNSYGAVTSVVSSLTVVSVPPATDYYSQQFLAYGPVGFWPLQETTEPAPGNWETNYGTLGELGNAYYACTNEASVEFDQPGALAGTRTRASFCRAAVPILTVTPLCRG